MSRGLGDVYKRQVYRHQAIPYSNIAYLIDIKCKFRYNSLCEFYDTKVGIGDVVCSFI